MTYSDYLFYQTNSWKPKVIQFTAIHVKEKHKIPTLQETERESGCFFVNQVIK